MASDTFREITSTDRRTDERVPVIVDDNEAAGFAIQSVGGVFDAAFELYRRHFGTLALIVACVFIPTQVVLHAAGNLWVRPLMAQINGENPDPLAVLQVGLLGFLIGAPQIGVPGYLSLLTSFMASGPIAVAVANILVGRPLNVAAAYQRVVPMFWRLFWTWTLFFLIYVLIFVVALIALLIALAGLRAGGLTAIGGQEMAVGFLVLIIVIPYVSSCALGTMLFAFAPPLIALENLTVLSAVERNARLLSRQRFWRVCLAVTLLPVVTFGLQFLILQSASSVVQAFKWPAWSEFVINTGLSSLINFFFQPYWMIFITLLYFDCRVRSEGLDVRYMADNLPEAEPLPEPAEANSSAAATPVAGVTSPAAEPGVPALPGPAQPKGESH